MCAILKPPASALRGIQNAGQARPKATLAQNQIAGNAGHKGDTRHEENCQRICRVIMPHPQNDRLKLTFLLRTP